MQKEERVTRLDTSYFFDGETCSMFLSNDEYVLILLFHQPAGYEVWDVGAAERRLPRTKLSEIYIISCAIAANRNCGCEPALFILVGGAGTWTDEFCLVEYSFGGSLEFMRKCPLSAKPTSVCSAGLSHRAAQENIVVGCEDGSVRLLSADAFDVSVSLKQREKSMLRSSTKTVAVTKEAGLVAKVQPQKHHKVSAVWNGPYRIVSFTNPQVVEVKHLFSKRKLLLTLPESSCTPKATLKSLQASKKC